MAALAAAHTAQRGADALVSSAARLARQQGRSWAEIGYALNITRQSAQGRFGEAADELAVSRTNGGNEVEIVAEVVIELGGGTSNHSYRYPVQVFRLADNTLIAVVVAAWGSPSLLEVSQLVMAEVGRRWPGTHVLEQWSSDTLGTTSGSAGHYAWSGGNGGHVPADLDDLARRGLDLR